MKDKKQSPLVIKGLRFVIEPDAIIHNENTRDEGFRYAIGIYDDLCMIGRIEGMIVYQSKSRSEAAARAVIEQENYKISIRTIHEKDDRYMRNGYDG